MQQKSNIHLRSFNSCATDMVGLLLMVSAIAFHFFFLTLAIGHIVRTSTAMDTANKPLKVVHLCFESVWFYNKRFGSFLRQIIMMLTFNCHCKDNNFVVVVFVIL